MNTQLCNPGRRGKLPEIAVVILAVVTGMVATCPARGGIAYLPSIGPVPLRLEVATTNVSSDWKSLWPLSSPVENAVVPVPVAETMTDPTNDIVIKVTSAPVTSAPVASAPVTNAISAASVSLAFPGKETNSEMSPGSFIMPVSTDDYTGPATPQILASFFKPNAGGKHMGGNNPAAAVAFIPAEIEFTPPSPKSGESRAIYKSQ